jgi:hypothetical protein
MPKGSKHHSHKQARNNKRSGQEAHHDGKPQTTLAEDSTNDNREGKTSKSWSVVSNQDASTTAQRVEQQFLSEDSAEATTPQPEPEKNAKVDPHVEEVENAVMSEVMEHKKMDMIKGGAMTPEDLVVRMADSEDGMRESTMSTDARDASFAVEDTLPAISSRPVEPISVGDVVMREEALKVAEAEALPEPPRDAVESKETTGPATDKSVTGAPQTAADTPAQKPQEPPAKKSFFGKKEEPARAPLATISAKENTPLQRPAQNTKEAASPKADCSGPLTRLIHKIFH